MMKSAKLLLFIGILAFAACQSKTKEKALTEDTNPDYKQTLALLFADSSGVAEWHDAPLDQEAVGSISLADGEANGQCGSKVMIFNNAERPAKVTVSTVYPFEDSPWEISQEYVVPAGASIHAGNNKICYGGKETAFVFKIEGASYLDN